jgi:prevent-host-death family protein
MKRSGRLSARIAAGEFKSRCLALIDEVERKRKEIVITKRGRPVAKLVPVESAANPLIGGMRCTISYMGDIVAPIGEPWDAAR